MMGPVLIRRPRPGDELARRTAGHSAEIMRMYGHLAPSAPQTSTAEARAWLKTLISHPCAWVIEVDGSAAGEIRLDNLNQTDRRARLAIGLLRDDHLGRGIGRQAIRLALAQGFGSLSLHRIDLRVLSFNHRAIRCYRACGFVHEGTERHSALIGGEWHDDLIMAILEPEYRALAPRP
jgi:RimJ/RimL family protein N-acetyltransferase